MKWGKKNKRKKKNSDKRATGGIRYYYHWSRAGTWKSGEKGKHVRYEKKSKERERASSGSKKWQTIEDEILLNRGANRDDSIDVSLDGGNSRNYRSLNRGRPFIDAENCFGWFEGYMGSGKRRVKRKTVRSGNTQSRNMSFSYNVDARGGEKNRSPSGTNP